MKLKPCPFCGGEAEFCTKLINRDGGWQTVVYVWCPICESKSNRVFYTAETDKIEAAEAWNRREQTDKIIRRLKERYGQSEQGYELNHFDTYWRGKCEAFDEAIEIVKGGVNNEE